MTTKKLIWVLFRILVIVGWIVGSAIQVGAETMNYKCYSHVVKADYGLIGDVEDHTFGMETRRSICVFENGDVATGIAFVAGDYIKGAGSNTSYATTTFADGSTIITKRQMAVTAPGGGLASGALKGEIIKGTGRFEGIKGSITSRTKWLPVEKGEAGPKTITEYIITYTLPAK